MTGPAVGSAVMLNVDAASLRVETGLPPWVADTPGTSLAVLTTTLMGVAYLVQSAFDVLKVSIDPATVAVQAVRAWRDFMGADGGGGRTLFALPAGPREAQGGRETLRGPRAKPP